jgi:hypothetical protein
MDILVASCADDIVFWRETGTKEDDDEVEAREGACSMATDIYPSRNGRQKLRAEDEDEQAEGSRQAGSSGAAYF